MGFPTDQSGGQPILRMLLGVQFPKWMLPEQVVFVDELPHTATGKIMKTQLREMFRDQRT
jgi:acyl-CoA synthetase (AMP-forming)/AMP-acid ligase II